MTVPSWIERGVKPELNDGEEIVDAHEVDSTLTSKIALVATNKRTLFVRDPMLGAAKVQAFRLKLPGGLTDGSTGTVAPPSETIEQPTEEKTWTEVQPGAEPTSTEPAADQEVTAELTEIKGIGPARAEQLSEAGIGGVAEFVRADPSSLAEAVGVNQGTVKGWQKNALESALELTDLTEVKGVGSARARSLVALGITTRAELASADPESVADELGVSTDQVEAWQAAASEDA